MSTEHPGTPTSATSWAGSSEGHELVHWDDTYFAADSAAQSLSGVHLAFHGLLFTGLSVLVIAPVDVHSELSRDSLVTAIALLGMLSAAVGFLRDIRMEAFRRVWAQYTATGAGEGVARYHQIETAIEQQLAELSRERRLLLQPLYWFAKCSCIKHSRRTLFGILPFLYGFLVAFTWRVRLIP